MQWLWCVVFMCYFQNMIVCAGYFGCKLRMLCVLSISIVDYTCWVMPICRINCIRLLYPISEIRQIFKSCKGFADICSNKVIFFFIKIAKSCVSKCRSWYGITSSTWNKSEIPSVLVLLQDNAFCLFFKNKKKKCCHVRFKHKKSRA